MVDSFQCDTPMHEITRNYLNYLMLDVYEVGNVLHKSPDDKPSYICDTGRLIYKYI